jgi:protein phosphatase
MTLQLNIAAHSEIGLVRKNNQDSGYASPNLLVVADGMGGAAAGDLASAVAIDSIRRADAPTAGDQMLEVLAGALHKANDRIADLVEADYSLEGMGTTVTGVLFDGAQFGLAHIGDSRAYLLHDSRLERLTHDHTWVQSLVDDGKINEGEAAVHPHRSLLLKVLNGQPANDPDLTMVKVVAGDRLLLCSDGLCGLVDDPVIEKALRLRDLDAALRRLVDEALAEGGVDNITVILADVIEARTPRQRATAEGSGQQQEVDEGATQEIGPQDALVLGAAAERDIPAVETRIRRLDLSGTDGDEESGADTEDTLITARRTAAGPHAPAADHDGTGASDDEARYNPQPPHKGRFTRPLVALLALLLVAGAGLGTAYAWSRTQYYVGAASDKVAIFQGLSDGFPGIPMSRVYEIQPLLVSALPPYYQEKVRADIDVADLTAARQTVSELALAAKRCAGKATATPTPNRSASGNPSTSATPSVKATGSASAPSGSASPRSASPTEATSATGPATPEVSC